MRLHVNGEIKATLVALLPTNRAAEFRGGLKATDVRGVFVSTVPVGSLDVCLNSRAQFDNCSRRGMGHMRFLVGA